MQTKVNLSRGYIGGLVLKFNLSQLKYLVFISATEIEDPSSHNISKCPGPLFPRPNPMGPHLCVKFLLHHMEHRTSSSTIYNHTQFTSTAPAS